MNTSIFENAAGHMWNVHWIWSTWYNWNDLSYWTNLEGVCEKLITTWQVRR